MKNQCLWGTIHWNLFPSSFALPKLHPKPQSPYWKIREDIHPDERTETEALPAPLTADTSQWVPRHQLTGFHKTQSPRKCSHLFNRPCRQCQRKSPGLCVLIPALPLADYLTSSKLFSPHWGWGFSSARWHGCWKGQGKQGHQNDTNEAEPQNTF